MDNKRQCIICGSSHFLARTENKCLKCLTSTRKKGGFVVGIDPDIKGSGFALYNMADRTFQEISNLSFFQLYDKLNECSEIVALVRIEAGWLNAKSNFHTKPGQTKEAGEKIAAYVGANAETGRKIAEMCKHLNIPYELVKPLGTKCIDQKIFKSITGYKKRTNQDSRDAAMLVWNYK